ncbi:M16 family metallopeptidase [Flavihumibacter profundi]|uniref:M16 family metallopeptidase n=1 Tax=Flavihumibacter profundi TaxID=2716883 RepID=UPI001CC7AC8C|nr:pitrilysin family protein [Flavihumibacter profundi]MBZ5858432.1 insulinase family protein [Flavihumibacter profundi]
MKQIICYIIAVTSLLTGVNCFGQTQLPAPGKPREFTLPTHKKFQLPNGFRATLVPYGIIPKVSVEVVVKTGAVHEGANEKWLARFTGKLMEEGSTKTDFATLSEKVAAMGGRLSISVGMETISIGGAVLSEFAPEFIKLIAEVITQPAFPAAAGDRLKNDMKRDLSVRKAQPDAIASERFFTMIYKDHPYGNKMATDEMIDSYSVEKAKAFYTKNFGARRSAIYIAGNYNEAAVSKAIKDGFSGWTKGPAVNYPPAIAAKNSEIAVIDRPNASQTVVFLGTPVADPTRPDYTQLEVTNSLLGGSFGSRITLNIREDKGYTYSPFSGIQNRQGNGVWYEKADITSESTADALKEIAKEISLLQSTPPSVEELKGIQNYEAGSFVLNNSSADGIIDQLSYMDLFGLDETYLTNRIRNINSVTPVQVQNMARKYLDYGKMTLVMVGDKKLLDTQMGTIKADRENVKKAF